MKIKVWSIFVALCMAVCVSCSSDEPKNANSSSTGKNDESTTIEMNFLARQPWLGTYFFERHKGKRDSEKVNVEFNPGGGCMGTGTMTVTRAGKSTEYKFDCVVAGDTIKCKAMPNNTADADNDIDWLDVTFVYKEGMLYMDSPEFAPAILGRNKEIFSSAFGIHKDVYYLVNKVWLHENGMNIYDLRDNSPFIYHLVAPGSYEYDSCNLGYGPAYDYVENTVCLFSTSMDIKEISEDKMVLSDFEYDCDVVLYRVSEDIISKLHYTNKHNVAHYTDT